MALGERLRNAWSAFKGRDPTQDMPYVPVYASDVRPDVRRLSVQNGNTIASTIYNMIAVDCSSIDIRHVRLDEEGRYEETIDDSLNQIFSLAANRDQTGRAFVRDIIISMLDEGVVALVPTVVDTDPNDTDAFKVYESRVGKILRWWPEYVLVEVFNDLTGRKQQIVVEKRYTPILENPFFEIMNQPNATSKRYTKLLSQLDRSNSEQSAGKVDLIIQAPQALKSPARVEMAENRRKAIEEQLTRDAQYGIAYVDATEKVIQLNRSLENNLWTQSKELQEELFSQMGLTKNVFNGTASEQEMLNYTNRTIEPIMTTIVEGVAWKWISKTARTQRQDMRFFRNPFKLVPVNNMAEIADKMTRNEIMSSNEIRTELGMKPSKDPKADQLINANLNQSKEEAAEISKSTDVSDIKI